MTHLSVKRIRRQLAYRGCDAGRSTIDRCAAAWNRRHGTGMLDTHAPLEFMPSDPRALFPKRPLAPSGDPTKAMPGIPNLQETRLI